MKSKPKNSRILTKGSQNDGTALLPNQVLYKKLLMEVSQFLVEITKTIKNEARRKHFSC